MRERKKVLYKQRKRINLLEKQFVQSSGPEEKGALNTEELEDYESDRQADWELIRKEKERLADLEEKFRQAQEQAELEVGKMFQLFVFPRHVDKISVKTLAAEIEELFQLPQMNRILSRFFVPSITCWFVVLA